MYKPFFSTEVRKSYLFRLIEEYSFGTLFYPGNSQTPEVAHLPFLLDRQRGSHGTLLSHIARANPLADLFAGAKEVVVIFYGPHGYISPSWYTSREEVPTWNYSVVHAYGIPHLIPDDELIALLGRLVAKYEQGNSDPWRLNELPADLFKKMIAEIVGFTIEITRFEGKFKLSQNRSLEDREGAIAGVRKRGNPLDTNLAAMMREMLQKVDEK